MNPACPDCDVEMMCNEDDSFHCPQCGVDWPASEFGFDTDDETFEDEIYIDPDDPYDHGAGWATPGLTHYSE